MASSKSNTIDQISSFRNVGIDQEHLSSIIHNKTLENKHYQRRDCIFLVQMKSREHLVSLLSGIHDKTTFETKTLS